MLCYIFDGKARELSISGTSYARRRFRVPRQCLAYEKA